MNALVVSNLFPNEVDVRKGLFVSHQTSALRDRGHDIRVLAPVPWVPPRLPVPDRWAENRGIPRSDIVRDVPVEYPRYFSLPGPQTIALSSIAARASLWWHGRRFEREFNPDLVNAHVALPNGFASISLAKLFDVPLVTTIHGADLQHSVSFPAGESLLGHTFRCSESLVVNSSKLASLLETRFLDTPPVDIVPNGIPIEMVRETASCDPPVAIDPDATVLITVGKLVETKGIHLVLDALAELPDVSDLQYIIIGGGPQRDALWKRVAERDLSDIVTFTGKVPHRTVFEHLHHADLFALPSYKEAFGIAYLEAMACGLPVIACEGEGPADFVEHDETGYLVPPRDVDELRRVIATLIDSPETRRRVGTAASEVVSEQYTWESNAARVEEIYKRAAQ